MQRKLRWRDHFVVNNHWLELTFVFVVITPLVLPHLVNDFLAAENKNTYPAIARVSGLAAAMFMPPVAGLLGDRNTSR